ncbi:MAG: helix-turn-helix domain-containing protein [Deltaproteobacteria bacterium]|nr:helix-turn-helix domain-containing protein [Deltaproteobacteria bacterium]
MAIESKNLPLHDFKMPAGEGVPFEIISYDFMNTKTRRLSQLSIPHRHTFYQILYYTGGAGTHFVDFESYPLHTPCLYFLSPGQVHFWDLNRPLEGYALVFTEDFLLLSPTGQSRIHELAFFHGFMQQPELKLNKAQKADVEALIHTIRKEYLASEFSRASMLRAYLHILLVKIQRMYDAAHAYDKNLSSQSTLVRRFKKLVSKEIAIDRSVKVYAESLGVGADHLRETVKTVTGKSPGQLIRQEVALEAKRLLAHTDLSAAEIGYRMAFEDPSYFSRFFKRETDMSPHHFRTHFQEKYHFSRN